MPTLRDDLIDARERATAASKDITAQVDAGLELTREQKLECIDAWDSLYELVDECLRYMPFTDRARLLKLQVEADDSRRALDKRMETGAAWTQHDVQLGMRGLEELLKAIDVVLPRIPDHVVGATLRGAGRSLGGTLKPDTGETNAGHTCHVKFVGPGGHELITVKGVHEVVEEGGWLLLKVPTGFGGVLAAFPLVSVWGYWFDIKGHEDQKDDPAWHIAWHRGPDGSAPLEDVLKAMDIVLAGDRWSLEKMLGPTGEQKMASIGYVFASAVKSIIRE